MRRRAGRRPTTRVRLTGEDDGRPAGPVVSTARPDSIAAEEPLELRVGGRALSVTMRTPGDDVDLAHGFLLTEGVVTRREDVAQARFCDGADGPDGLNTYNVLDVSLAPGVEPPAAAVERRFPTTSACGVCGKASIDAVRTRTAYPVDRDPVRLDPVVLAGLPAALREEQAGFDRTGGLHAAGLFTATGERVLVREDVGRHNAVDKVLGAALRAGRLPLTGHVLMVSGRASFELTQKAWMAGLPALCAVSAPSTLAVDVAVEAGITLVGFLRGATMNCYARPDRLGLPASSA